MMDIPKHSINSLERQLRRAFREYNNPLASTGHKQVSQSHIDCLLSAINALKSDKETDSKSA